MVRGAAIMKSSVCALFFLPLVSAWTFLYTNSTGDASILHNTGPSGCKKITLAANELFSWDPEGENVCISIYRDENCVDRAGISCGVDGAWEKDASSDFYGAAVTDNSVPSSTPTVTTATSTSTSSASSTETSATTTTNKSTTAAAVSSSGSSLSGGAIAGIVIGVIAGVSIIGALFFFYGRRQRNRNKAAAMNELPSSTPQGPYAPQSAMFAAPYQPASSMDASEKPPTSSGAAYVRPAPGSRVVELAGHTPSAELVTSPISELDGQSGGKHCYRF